MPFLAFLLGAFLGSFLISNQITTDRIVSAEKLCELNGGLRFVAVNIYDTDKIYCANGAKFNREENK